MWEDVATCLSENKSGLENGNPEVKMKSVDNLDTEIKNRDSQKL